MNYAKLTSWRQSICATFRYVKVRWLHTNIKTAAVEIRLGGHNSFVANYSGVNQVKSSIGVGWIERAENQFSVEVGGVDGKERKREGKRNQNSNQKY